MRHIAAFAVVSTLIAAPAAAQVCAGGSSFDVSRAQLSAGGSFGKEVTSFSGGLRVGQREGVFAGASAGGTVYDYDLFDERGNRLHVNESSFGIGASLGYQVPIGTAKRAQVCPVVSGFYEIGPKDVAGTDTDYTSGGTSLGLFVGGEAPLSSTVSVIPTAGGEFVYARSRVTAPRFAETTSDTYGVLTLGAALSLNRRFTFGPSVSIPLGVEGGETRFGFDVSLGLGRR